MNTDRPVRRLAHPVRRTTSRGTTRRLLSPDDAVGDVARLREQPGGDLSVMGSVSLCHALIAAGLVYEDNLMIEPIVLGGGKRLFTDDGVARPLELVKATTASTGVQVCTFRPAS